MNKVTLLCFLLGNFTLFAQNQPPSITNVQVTMSGANLLTIQYDLSDAENDPIKVTFRAAARGSVAMNYNTGNATGHVGANITPGSGKQIQWNFSAYANEQPDFRLQLIAEDFKPIDIASILTGVDSSRLLGDLIFLEGVRHRIAGAERLQDTKEFIEFHFKENHVATSFQPFAYGNYQAHNVIGNMIGMENENSVYILGAHFDTVDDSPGADDNASGLSGMLEAMRILSKYGFKKSIRFIGFDLEEEGLKGSAKYVESGLKPGETVEGMVDLEMIGYHTEEPNTQSVPLGFGLIFPDAVAKLEANEYRGDFILNVGGGISTGLAAAYGNVAAQYVPALKVVTLQPPALIPDLARSDHASFWLKNIPAVMLTDGADFRNPYYHTSNDTVGTLNFTFMHNVVQATVATIAGLADIQHAGTWWADTQFFTPAFEVAGCEWQVSPNPTREVIRLNWKNSCPVQDVELQLFDLSGRAVKQVNFLPANHGDQFSMDVSGLERGMYFLQISSFTSSHTEKIVLK
jgi:Zn-dependent M28 family amino/carboxypeptidase